MLERRERPLSQLQQYHARAAVIEKFVACHPRPRTGHAA